MFIEPHFRNTAEGQLYDSGWIEVICGCMFSGKTEELIRRMKRAQLARQSVRIFKPVVDVRYHLENIVSHNQNAIPSTPVKNPKEIIFAAHDAQVVGIDEAQFFDESIVEVVQHLANHGRRVILAGLDMDSNGKPFGAMPQLMAVAEFVHKVQAICIRCGAVAGYSYRRGQSNETFLLGANEIYEARCRKCFNLGKES